MKLLIVDDHPLILMALQQSVGDLLPECTVKTAQSLNAALEQLQQHTFDLLILDLFLGPEVNSNPFDNLQKIRQTHPDLNVVLISGADVAEHAQQAIALGAKGFIPKCEDPKLLLAAIHIILQGGTYLPATAIQTSKVVLNGHKNVQQAVKLTCRQKQVLDLLEAGMTNKRIAMELDISVQTVKAHVTSLMGAMQVENRTQIVLCAAEIDKRFPGWRSQQDLK